MSQKFHLCLLSTNPIISPKFLDLSRESDMLNVRDNNKAKEIALILSEVETKFFQMVKIAEISEAYKEMITFVPLKFLKAILSQNAFIINKFSKPAIRICLYQ